MQIQEIALYGAGKNAAKVLDNLSANLIAVCFADANPDKHHTVYGESGLYILPIAKARQQYPSAKWIITIANTERNYEVQEELIQKGLLNRENILNPVSKRLSCELLETTISPFNSQSVTFCRGGRFQNMQDMPHVDWIDSAETVDAFLSLRERTLKELQESADTHPCKGCVSLCETPYHPDKYSINNVVFSTSPHSICNFKCDYCYSGHFGNSLNADERHSDRSALINELENRKLISPLHTIMHWSDGEVTVDPRRKEIYDISERYNSIFYTNAGLYSKEIASLMERGKARICVSIDSGTSDTFKKIKRVNAYDKVVKNLRDYAKNNCNQHIWIKYIFMPDVNDNETDISAFIALCKELEPGLVIIASDYNIGKTDMNDLRIERLSSLVLPLLELGLMVSTEYIVSFSDSERRRLYNIAEHKRFSKLQDLREILYI